MLATVSNRPDSKEPPDAAGRLGWALAAVGCAGALGAALLNPNDARSAAAQVWSPFVLVAGLLLGLVADEDRLFSAAGHALARLAPNGLILYVGSVALIVGMTTVLNVDTSVALLTPILVYTARNRGEGEGAAPLRVPAPVQCRITAAARLDL